MLANLLAAGRLDLAPVEDLEREIPPHRLAFDEVADGLRSELVVGEQDQLGLGLGQLEGGALEVVALLNLASNLVERVAHFLIVEVADYVER